MIPIPNSVSGFDVAWLNAVLADRLDGGQVTSCNAKSSDIPGQTAEIVMLELSYEPVSLGLPTRMVAKYTSQNPMIIEQLIANYDQYRRESSFYREFPDIGISVPNCLYQKYDAAHQEFVILM